MDACYSFKRECVLPSNVCISAQQQAAETQQCAQTTVWFWGLVAVLGVVLIAR